MLHDIEHDVGQLVCVFGGGLLLGILILLLLRGQEALPIVQGITQTREGVDGRDGLAGPAQRL